MKLTEKDKQEIREQIGLSIGEASMCWVPLPSTEVFDSTSALKINDKLYNYIINKIESVIDEELPDENIKAPSYLYSTDGLDPIRIEKLNNNL